MDSDPAGCEVQDSRHSSATLYLIRLDPPLDTPEKLQEVAGLPRPPKTTPPEALSNDNGSDIGEEQDNIPSEKRFVRISQCAKQAIVEWSSRHKAIYNPLIIPTTVHSNNVQSGTGEQEAFPCWYFLYDTLQQPEVLARLLGLAAADLILRRPARITRYVLKQREESKELVDTSSPSSSLLEPSTVKFRPAGDVLSRIRWDPVYNSKDYTIVYLDRFKGPLEIEVDAWKSETTDDEFIPQHRIVQFRRKVDGLVLWDRNKGTDLIFESWTRCSVIEGTACLICSEDVGKLAWSVTNDYKTVSCTIELLQHETIDGVSRLPKPHENLVEGKTFKLFGDPKELR